jgi:LPPG:FO 2-phospho-L-lactate transferase
VKGFRFAGIESARPAPGVLQALATADAVVICPSNPWVSVDPILAVITPPGLHPAEQGKALKRVVAVSPFIGGRAIKGPAAKMSAELGLQPNPLTITTPGSACPDWCSIRPMSHGRRASARQESSQC